MPEHFKEETGLTRRTVMRTAAWSVPVIATAVATPMAAASPPGTLSDFLVEAFGLEGADMMYVFAVASPEINMTLQPSYFTLSGLPSIDVAWHYQHRYDNLAVELVLTGLIFPNENRMLTVNLPGFAPVTVPIVFS